MLGAAVTWDAITAICMIVITLAVLATAGGIVLMVLKVRSTLTAINRQIQPITEKGGRILDSVERTVDLTGERIQRVAQRTDETVAVVNDHVRSITTLVSDLISHPLISAASLAAGVRRAVETLGSQSNQPTSQQ